MEAPRQGEAAVFEAQRRHLTGLAYRMLGSLAEAQDVVQEAYLRWHQADCERVANPHAYLSRTVARLCLDHLKSGRARHDQIGDQRNASPIKGNPVAPRGHERGAQA
jgi:RNA polymerase sigma-70 factor (ECF subfamily)